MQYSSKLYAVEVDRRNANMRTYSMQYYHNDIMSFLSAKQFKTIYAYWLDLHKLAVF